MMNYVIIDSRWVIDKKLVNLSAVAAAFNMHAVPSLCRVIKTFFSFLLIFFNKTQIEVA